MLEIKDVDVVVIGMEPGGEEVASRLAESGLQVIGIEDALVGGECPYWGYIPSEMMIRAANVLAETRRVNGLAGAATVEPDWAIVAARIRAEATDDWDDKVAVDRFEAKGGTLIRGRGSIESPGVVAIGELRFRASRAVMTATKVLAASHDNDRFTLTLNDERIVEAERLLVATGRRPILLSTSDLGFDRYGYMRIGGLFVHQYSKRRARGLLGFGVFKRCWSWSGDGWNKAVANGSRRVGNDGVAFQHRFDSFGNIGSVVPKPGGQTGLHGEVGKTANGVDS